MRSVAEKLPYWRRVVFYSSADIGCFACVLGEGLFALEWASTHLTPLAAAHVCQGHMLVCMAVYTQGMQPLYLGPTRGPELVVSLVSRQAITSPKLGQFSAMTATRVRYLAQRKEIVAVSIVFFVRGWNRATLYKEDYEDKTTLTSLKFEDTSREMWKVSKSSCSLEGLVLRALVNVMNATENTENEFYLWTEKADTWQNSASQSGSRQYHAEQSLLSAVSISLTWITKKEKKKKNKWMSMRKRIIARRFEREAEREHLFPQL